MSEVKVHGSSDINKESISVEFKVGNKKSFHKAFITDSFIQPVSHMPVLFCSA